MDFKSYSFEFSKKAKESGYSDENINRCLKYAEKLITNDLPVIYNHSHLALLVGYRVSYLTRAVIFTKFFYRTFVIKKHNNKHRAISEPLPSLKDIQTWILKKILYKIPCSKYAKAYIPTLTIKKNLVFHRGQPKVLKLDIRDFFSNIRRLQVEKLLYHIGYNRTVANLISKLCCLSETLPQGAPTSPYISNLILKEFDNSIGEYCTKHDIRFTRFADDITFSGDFDHLKIINLVESLLKKLGLELNVEKTKLMFQENRQTVTGIVVNQKLQVVRYKRKRLRQIMYYINRFGFENHLLRVKCNKTEYLRHILGQVCFILFINPEDKEFIKYKSQLITMVNNSKNKEAK